MGLLWQRSEQRHLTFIDLFERSLFLLSMFISVEEQTKQEDFMKLKGKELVQFFKDRGVQFNKNSFPGKTEAVITAAEAYNSESLEKKYKVKQGC